MQTAYIDKNTLITYPDAHVKPKPHYTYIATLGSKYTLVAVDGDETVGWVFTSALGYHTVAHWLEYQHNL